MQNYIKIQDELKGVPDAVLAGYMKNPTGEAPQFLVSSEIQRRTDMRAKFQNNQPQSTVADDLEQKLTGGLASLPQEQQAPQEDQGIAGLPTDMPEVSAAGGGIIAFDDGGYIKLTKKQYDRLIPSEKQKYVNQYGTPPEGDEAERTALEKLGIIAPPTALEEAIKHGTKLRPEVAQVPTGNIPNIPSQLTTPATVDNAYINSLAKNIAPTAPRVARPPVAPNAPATINDGLGNILPDQSSAYKGLLQAEQTPAEKMAELQDLIGVDPNKEIMQARLAKMDESAQKSSEQAPWMAALQAGLGMMSGTSPYAMTNIGAGALMGTKDYAAAQDKADANEEKRFNLSNQLGKADYDAKVAAATYGENSSQAIKTQNKATQLAGLTAAAQVAKDKADNALKQKELKINEEHYKNADAVARIVANKPPAEVSLIERYMNDPKFALASDKINLSKKESQALQDMRDLFIKAKTTIGSPYKDTTFSDFVKMFNPSAQTATTSRKFDSSGKPI